MDRNCRSIGSSSSYTSPSLFLECDLFSEQVNFAGLYVAMARMKLLAGTHVTLYCC